MSESPGRGGIMSEVEVETCDRISRTEPPPPLPATSFCPSSVLAAVPEFLIVHELEFAVRIDADIEDDRFCRIAFSAAAGRRNGFGKINRRIKREFPVNTSYVTDTDSAQFRPPAVVTKIVQLESSHRQALFHLTTQLFLVSGRQQIPKVQGSSPKLTAIVELSPCSSDRANGKSSRRLLAMRQIAAARTGKLSQGTNSKIVGQASLIDHPLRRPCPPLSSEPDRSKRFCSRAEPFSGRQYRPASTAC